MALNNILNTGSVICAFDSGLADDRIRVAPVLSNAYAPQDSYKIYRLLCSPCTCRDNIHTSEPTDYLAMRSLLIVGVRKVPSEEEEPRARRAATLCSSWCIFATSSSCIVRLPPRE